MVVFSYLVLQFMIVFFSY